MSTVAERLDWLERCAAFHGHLCMGQALGVRVAIKGMELIAPAKAPDIVVVVENGRCIADAVLTVSNTRIGRRTLKITDYGLNAAVFHDPANGASWRVRNAWTGERLEDPAALRALMERPDEELVAWKRVTWAPRPFDAPGHALRTVACSACGEIVHDGRDVPGVDGPLCQPCAHGAYWKEL